MPQTEPRDGAKTFVLVHGAFHGAWCWKKVAQFLRDQGHVVYTPTLTGLGERSHLLSFGPTLDTFLQDVIQVLDYEELRDVILVGHSYGGAVITGVADRVPQRLRHLVYLDALVLQSGQCTSDLAPRDLIEQYKKLAMETSNGVTIPPKNAAHFGVTDPDLAAWLETKLTPQPFQTYFNPLVLQNPVGNGIPATYIAAADPPFGGTIRSREFARTVPGWTYEEMPTGHDIMLTMPGELAARLARTG